MPPTPRRQHRIRIYGIVLLALGFLGCCYVAMLNDFRATTAASRMYAVTEKQETFSNNEVFDIIGETAESMRRMTLSPMVPATVMLIGGVLLGIAGRRRDQG